MTDDILDEAPQLGWPGVPVNPAVGAFIDVMTAAMVAQQLRELQRLAVGPPWAIATWEAT